jgi:type IV secretory pathway VirB4 component
LLPWSKRDTAQNSIPFEAMYDDGICYLGNDTYSAAYSFEDTNYSNTEEQERVDTFERYCEFLNAFDETIKFQIHILTKQLSKTNINLYIKAPPNASDDLRQCVDEYNDMLKRRLNGNNSFIQQKYITITISEDSYEKAKSRFDRIDNDILQLLRQIGCNTKMLNKVQRLILLREIYRPDDNTDINYNRIAHTGVCDKDLIAPYSIDTSHDNYIKLGNYYSQTLFLTELPDDLSDELVKEITSIDESILLTINVLPQNPQLAIKEVKQRLKMLDIEKENNRSRQLKMGVAIPEPPRELRKAIENTEIFQSELETRNEKMFLANVLINIHAKTLEELDEIFEKIENKVVKSGCTLKPFTFAQEDGFNSVIPLGRNDTFVKRTLTTTSLAVFIPFNVIEIVQPGGLLYGKNKLSNNIICLNRKLLQNPHGFIFGASGSGKSMQAKIEIWECFFRTDDDIIIIDIDGEFTKLVELLGGQVIYVSNSAKTRFNPFDINKFYGGDNEPNPIPFKSDFIISLIEVTLNYHDGIDPVMRSVIDRCVRYIYRDYMENQCEKNVPTFMDFYEVLKKQKEPEAAYLASALEIYIKGSLNIFASKTNVDINNRLICFNTKELGSQLKVMGMTIIQDFCWNLISKNQALNKNTWLWNDEIHHSLRHSSTANWLINSWKRGRKYGLVATGMTQEVRDVCKSEDAKALIANSEFIMLYRHKPDMVQDIAQVMSLSDKEIKKLLTCEEGTGLFKAGNSIVEFNNRFDDKTKLFDILSTDIGKENQKVG